jgi:lysophospholipase L1-like esterase
MNSRGFRGDDFPVEKGPEVTRVVTLGASSTFGYHSRDDDTYPHEMQQILNDRCAPRRFEVINLGIPHLSSDQILALFVDEALPLRPDVVTFYEGVNDSEGGTWRLPRRRSTAQQIRLLVRKTFLTAKLIRDVMRQEDLFGASDIEAEIAEKAPRFLANLEEIETLCGEQGISFLVATQQAKSSLLDPDEIRGVTYADEIHVIEEVLAREGELRWPEKNLLVHQGLMDALRGWARERGVPLVDVIEALDPRRDTLVSWVHLTPEGNRMIAEAFADTIAGGECR